MLYFCVARSFCEFLCVHMGVEVRVPVLVCRGQWRAPSYLWQVKDRMGDSWLQLNKSEWKEG